MIFKTLFSILTFMLYGFTYIFPAHAGMGTPPSPSFSWFVKPHIYVSEVDNTYYKKKTITHVNHHIRGPMTSEQTEWEPQKPSPYIVVAARAQVSGFGIYKAEVNAKMYEGVEGEEQNLKGVTKWVPFGSVGTLGPVPTWREVKGIIAQAICIDYLEITPSPDPTKGYVFSGKGKIFIKQKEWTPYGEGGLPWGIVNGGSWDNGDIEEFPVPDNPSNGIGGYTIKSPITVVNSHVVTAKPYKKIHWFLKLPDQEGDGHRMDIQEGGAKKTQGSFTHQFNTSGVEGTYKITAKIYNFSDDSVYTRSHDVEYTHNFNVIEEQAPP